MKGVLNETYASSHDFGRLETSADCWLSTKLNREDWEVVRNFDIVLNRKKLVSASLSATSYAYGLTLYTDAA